MNERIVFTNPDGSVCVLTPAEYEDCDLTLDEIFAKDVPADATNARILTTDELPKDRLFRNAWDDSNPENFIGINLDKAIVIAHDIRRQDRSKKLKPLDKEKGYASTTDTRKAEIAVEAKTILAANAIVQKDIDGVKDEDALRAIIN